MVAGADKVMDADFDEALADLLAAIYPDYIPRDHYPRLIQIMEAACRLADVSGAGETQSPVIEIHAPKPKDQLQKPKTGRPSGLPKDSDLIPDIVAKREAGASTREIHRWLHEKGVRVSYSTINKRIKEAQQKGQAPHQGDLIEPPEPENDINEGPPEIAETAHKASSRTEELRRLAIEMGAKRAVDPQAPIRGRDIGSDDEVTERHGIGADGLDLSDVDVGGEDAD